MEVTLDTLLIVGWILIVFYVRPTAGEIDDIRKGVRELLGKGG
ncbi:hypothetical protein [Burkholderia phage BCSR52]|jgi:hypothetical protein|uniref:Uncharacterized protein n=1 Tax=Burkholderia phage BCSR52 TaxID=2805748 RepID=A0A889IPV7_9CAUD|nr:hypothetical protein [Burkholderia phage BCSR52]